jgi:nitrogen fixation protein
MGTTTMMTTEILTERERQTLEHLKQAQELGSTLTDFATAFNLNVQDLYSGKAQLQRKGFWPTKSAEPVKTELLAVQVVAQSAGEEARVCRVTVPNGWTMEFSQWPQAAWLAALMGAQRAT